MKKMIAGALLGAIAAASLTAPAAARAPAVSQQSLLDRIQVEDMMVEYYTILTNHVRHNIGDYFTEEAFLDVNGFRLEGRAAIQHFYDNGTDNRIQPSNTYFMQFSNPRVVVTGDKAVLDVVWTGYLSDNQYSAPRLVEQGTEQSTFTKQNGTWMITGRKLVNTGGMPTVIGENAGN